MQSLARSATRPINSVVFCSHHEAGEEPGVDQSRLSQLHPRCHIPGHAEVRVLHVRSRGPIQSRQHTHARSSGWAGTGRSSGNPSTKPRRQRRIVNVHASSCTRVSLNSHLAAGMQPQQSRAHNKNLRCRCYTSTQRCTPRKKNARLMRAREGGEGGGGVQEHTRPAEGTSTRQTSKPFTKLHGVRKVN